MFFLVQPAGNRPATLSPSVSRLWSGMGGNIASPRGSHIGWMAQDVSVLLDLHVGDQALGCPLSKAIMTSSILWSAMQSACTRNLGWLANANAACRKRAAGVRQERNRCLDLAMGEAEPGKHGACPGHIRVTIENCWRP